MKGARLLAFLLGLVACSAVGSKTADGESRATRAPTVAASSALPAVASAPPAATSTPSAARASEPGRADLDPDNDLTVAPPDPIPDCDARLTAAGVKFRPTELALRKNQTGRYVCGAPQVVIYERGPGAIAYNAPPLLTCGMALALARFELSLQRESEQALGSRISRIRHGGSYSCRKMARFAHMVSEHSYANAIDLYAFTLEDGRTLSVAHDFGKPQLEPTRQEGKFLRQLARKTFDGGLFSVVLTPFWDRLHSDHFHVDLARYRVDGTR